MDNQINGETISVYHGSPYSFAGFNASSSGIHFGSFDQAVHAATLKLARMPTEKFAALEEIGGWRGKVYKCEIDLGKTKRIKDPRTPQAWARQIKKAAADGFTAIVYCNEFEGAQEADSYCVFSPDRIISINLE